jgi:hypothetical protein
MGMTAKQHSDLVKQAKAEYDSLYNKDYINKAKEAKAVDYETAVQKSKELAVKYTQAKKSASSSKDLIKLKILKKQLDRANEVVNSTVRPKTKTNTKGTTRAEERAEIRFQQEQADRAKTKETKKMTASQAYDILDEQLSPEGLSPLESIKRKMALESLGLTEEQIKEPEVQAQAEPIKKSFGDKYDPFNWIQGKQEEAIAEYKKLYPNRSEEQIIKAMKKQGLII